MQPSGGELHLPVELLQQSELLSQQAAMHKPQRKHKSRHAEPDLQECYTLAARMIFLNGHFPVGWPLGDETLLPSLSQAWPALTAGTWNDTVLTISHPFMFMSLLVIFFSALARRFKAWYAVARV